MLFQPKSLLRDMRCIIWHWLQEQARTNERVNISHILETIFRRRIVSVHEMVGGKIVNTTVTEVSSSQVFHLLVVFALNSHFWVLHFMKLCSWLSCSSVGNIVAILMCDIGLSLLKIATCS